MTLLDYRDPEYWKALRRPKVENPWPEHDPAPEVTTRDPRPSDAPGEPKAVTALAKLGEVNGWQVKIGYSRALLRGVKLGTYRRTESFSVWFSPSDRRRPRGIYTRFVDAKEVLRWDGKRYVTDVEPAGEPGTWSWTGRIDNYIVNFTQLKDFIKVRGSVLPSWFSAIVAAQEAAREKAKEQAKKRTKTVEDGG